MQIRQVVITLIMPHPVVSRPGLTPGRESHASNKSKKSNRQAVTAMSYKISLNYGIPKPDSFIEFIFLRLRV